MARKRYPSDERSEARRKAEWPERDVYMLMVRRCTKPNGPSFRFYGGRGIRVAPEWLGRGGFQRFLDHVGRRPGRGWTIDRKESTGHYEPGNVRWVETAKEQQRNRRDNHLVTALGETLCLSEWEERTGIKQELIRYRLKAGWAPDRAVSVPANEGRRHRTITIDGVTKTVARWAAEQHLHRCVVHSRLQMGWSERDAVFTPLKIERKPRPSSDTSGARR